MGTFCQAITSLFNAWPIEALFVLMPVAFEGLHVDMQFVITHNNVTVSTIQQNLFKES